MRSEPRQETRPWCTHGEFGLERRKQLLRWRTSFCQGITGDDEEEEDSKATDEAEITGQAAPDKLRAELQRRKKEAEQ